MTSSWQTVALMLLCLLVSIDIILKAILYTRMMVMLGKSQSLIEISERHARINDEQKERVVETLERVKTEAQLAAKKAAEAVEKNTCEIKTAVEQVPPRVVEEIKKTSDSVDSKNRLPSINPQTSS